MSHHDDSFAYHGKRGRGKTSQHGDEFAMIPSFTKEGKSIDKYARQPVPHEGEVCSVTTELVRVWLFMSNHSFNGDGYQSPHAGFFRTPLTNSKTNKLNCSYANILKPRPVEHRMVVESVQFYPLSQFYPLTLFYIYRGVRNI